MMRVMRQLKNSRKVPRPFGPGTYAGSVRESTFSKLMLLTGASLAKELKRIGMRVSIPIDDITLENYQLGS